MSAHRYPCPDIDCEPCSERAEKDADARREEQAFADAWKDGLERYEREVDGWGPQT